MITGEGWNPWTTTVSSDYPRSRMWLFQNPPTGRLTVTDGPSRGMDDGASSDTHVTLALILEAQPSARNENMRARKPRTHTNYAS
jgi:hypothetical protein